MTIQLDLLRRGRGAMAPPAKERATHIAIADTIRVSKSPRWIAFHCPNGELREIKTAALLKRMLVLPGVSDFLFVGPPAGQLHALELKRRGEKPNEAQIAFLAAVLDVGGHATWVNSYDAAIDQLKAWGVLRSNITVAA